MIKILTLHSEGITNGKINARCDISVADSSELATETDNTVFTDGSIAWDISTGDFYGLANGSWYKQDGTGAYSSGG